MIALAPRLTEGVAGWRDRRAVRDAVLGWVTGSLAEAAADERAVFVAEDDGMVLGFVTCGEREHFTGEVDGYVGELVVAGGCVRRGVGRALMTAAEQWAAAGGCPTSPWRRVQRTLQPVASTARSATATRTSASPSGSDEAQPLGPARVVPPADRARDRARRVGRGSRAYVTRDRSCFPGRPHAAPASVAAGEQVVVTATAFGCARRFHSGAFVGLQLDPDAGADDGSDQVVLGSAFPVDRDGSFRARVRIPDTAAAGPAVIRFTGFDIDELYDEVCSEKSCGTFGAAVVIR